MYVCLNILHNFFFFFLSSNKFLMIYTSTDLHFGLYVCYQISTATGIRHERAKILSIKFQEHLFSESGVVTYRWTHNVQLTGAYSQLFDTNMSQKAKFVVILVHEHKPQILHHGPNSFLKNANW